jgi:hypothetical protein
LPDPSRRDELKARVYARAKQIRFRRRLQIAGAIAGTTAVLATIAGVALLPGDPVRDVSDVAGDLPFLEPSPTPHKTPEATPTAEPTPVPTPYATPACRNSFEPACGEFRWDPPITDDTPTEAEMSVVTQDPVVGEKVVFAITITDDTPTEPHAHTWSWGDGPAVASSYYCEPPGPRERTGPWTPPEPEKTTTETNVEHTYEEPGTYTVKISYSTRKLCGDHPSAYGGDVEATVRFTVEPAPTPGPLDTPTPQP